MIHRPITARRSLGTAGLRWMCALLVWGTLLVTAEAQPPTPPSETPAVQPADKPAVPPDKPAAGPEKPESKKPEPEQPPEPPPAPKRLYEQEPFDQITLDKANDYAVLKVMPLGFPNGRLPDKAKRVGKLRVRLVTKRDEEYEVAWRNIDKIEFFGELVLAAANQVVAAGTDLAAADKLSAAQQKFDEAFDYEQFLLRFHPETPGLKESVEAFLYTSAVVTFKQQRVAEAFSMLEDLYRRNKNYRHQGGPRTVLAAMERTGEILVRQYLERGNLVAARQLLERWQKTYGEELTTAVRLATELRDRAAKKRDEAAAHLAAQRFREAHDASREMLNIWPRVDGGAELIQKIARQYPLIVVGVAQPALNLVPDSLDDWAARRAGQLVYPTLTQYASRGPEGGVYTSAFGAWELSDDRKQLLLTLRPGEVGVGLTSDAVVRCLLAWADPADPDYRPTWASLMAGVRRGDANRLAIGLRRPHVLPQALLQARLAGSGEPPSNYRVASRDDREVRFEPVTAAAGTGDLKPVLVERWLSEPRKAIEALRDGKVDVLDRLLPSDVPRLRQDQSLQVARYAFPTIHVLVPNREHPHLGNRIFRRALVYGLNREVILRTGLLNNQALEGCRVLSAPLPAGVTENDPSAYAYDSRIAPLPYDPVMGTILLRLADQQLAAAADARKEPAPELKELVLAHPAAELPRFACQKIRAQLDALGVRCKLRELPAGQVTDADQTYDLLYLELVLCEPLVDVQAAFGTGGVLPVPDPYVRLVLRQLEQADSWRTVRERLQDLHRLLYEDVTVLPLWQITDHVAYQRGLEGVAPRPVRFYQNVEQWRVAPRDIRE